MSSKQNTLNISFSSLGRINMYIFQVKGDCSLERFMYRGNFMLANQFQLMIHYSLIHFLWSHFQVIIMKQDSADTAFWVKQACIWIAFCLRGKFILWKQKKSSGFQILLSPQFIGIVCASDWYIKSKIKYHRAIAFFENSCILQCPLLLKQLFSI